MSTLERYVVEVSLSLSYEIVGLGGDGARPALEDGGPLFAEALEEVAREGIEEMKDELAGMGIAVENLRCLSNGSIRQVPA